MTPDTRGSAVSIDTPMVPPAWALMERELIKAQTQACQEFFQHYFDERGYLLCVPRWGGDDGPDDAAENLINWTMLHALGAPDVVLEMYKRGWEGHLRQYTEAKTVEVPMGRDGMYYKEFPVMFDWFHHGEWLSAFYLQGLSDPHDRSYLNRLRRYSGFYMGEDPTAPNYDPEHRIIRSMFNGSRGPLMRKATALDWAGDPIELEGRFKPGHGERSYQEMLDHFEEYNDVVGDHPMNMATTTLAFNAYALTGEPKYRDWILEYVDAWVERTEVNDGLIPTNIGLDGSIGGECGGRWYGGVYGWGFSVIVPQTGEVAHRPSFQDRAHYGFGNALLLTGDRRYVDLWSRMIDKVNLSSKVVDGEVQYPRMHGDQGWYDYRPEPFSAGALETYYWSMDPVDLQRVRDDDWIAFLQGEDPDYPVAALQRDFATLREKVQAMHDDPTTPDTRMSDDPNQITPAVVENLTRLMLGGLPTGRMGSPLHCRVRYFDPDRRRAGIPEDVAALVDTMSGDQITLTLVNVNQVEDRSVIVQGGGYGEHRIKSVTVDGRVSTVDGPHFAVRLAPGAGSRMRIKMERYANRPTFAFPWT